MDKNNCPFSKNSLENFRKNMIFVGQSIMLWFSNFHKKHDSINFLYIFCEKDLGIFYVLII